MKVWARRTVRNHSAAIAVSLLVFVLVSVAQDPTADIPSGKIAPSITMSGPRDTTIARGKAGTVQLRFHIGSGFHINSNKPKSEFLIPTVLKLDAPTDIVIGKITYPVGEDRSFPFAPDDKLSVYTGDFAIGVLVRPLKSVLPTKYAIHGRLNYQACDNAACYPPKQLPVSFEVKVAKSATEHKKRIPPQSPHTHS